MVQPALAGNLIELANRPADLVVWGESVGGNMGAWNIATGDVNGDGVEDLVASACNTHPLGSTRVGTVYVIWGTTLQQQGPVDLAANPGGVSRIFGKPGDDDLACYVSCGDLNHDGCDDIIWGQPLTGTAQSTGTGKAYIIFGSPVFPDTVDIDTAPSGVVTVYGDVSYATVGRTSCACDMDGDGYQDAIITAPNLHHSEVYIIRGRDTFPSQFHTGVPQPGMIRVIDNLPDSNMQGLACADINDDGCDDLVMGAIQDERLVLLYGSPALSTTDSIPLANPPVPMKIINGEYSHGALGISLAFGDLDHDGRLDLAAGAYHADPLGCYDCGEVYVFYDADALPDTVDLATTAVRMTRVMGTGTATHYGYRVMCADVTGDSIDDLVLSNRPYENRAITSVIFGRMLMPATVLMATENGPITRIKEAVAGDHLGDSMASTLVRGTRYLMLGAPLASPPGVGGAGIIYGFSSPRVATDLPATPPAASPRITSFPNPFSGQTTITFPGLTGGAVEVTIYDVSGRRVFETTVTGHAGGDLVLIWDGRDQSGERLPSGTYFCRARGHGSERTRKLNLVR